MSIKWFPWDAETVQLEVKNVVPHVLYLRSQSEGKMGVSHKQLPLGPEAI